MITLRNLLDVRSMPDGAMKEVLETRAILCHENDPDVMREMEESFNGSLGGNWYVFEQGDDLHCLNIEESCPVDLLTDEWNWCDEASMENGYYFIFWGTNNAGGFCLFVADEPWLPIELKIHLDALIAKCIEG